MSDNAAKAIVGTDIPDDDRLRFWSKVSFRGFDDCWPWKRGATSLGYGRFKFHRRQLAAPRVAFALAEGRAPADVFVLHRCDNPRCCNPRHLFSGSAKDNTQDALRKGRMKFKPCDPSHFNIGKWRAENLPFQGSSHPAAKLNERVVSQIKKALVLGRKGLDLAREFHCSTHTISNIKLHKQWKHV